MSCSIVLKSGQTFKGRSFGAPVSTSGELVFQTGMVGYTESLSDPSYRGQLLILSFSLIGNYGVPSTEEMDGMLLKFLESNGVHVAALIVADYTGDEALHSHWNAKSSLGTWLKKHGIPGVTCVDTRALIKLIRDGGATLAKLVQADDDAAALDWNDPNSRNLVGEVVTYTEPWVMEPGQALLHKPLPAPVPFLPPAPQYAVPADHGPLRLLVVDCGLKNNQLRCLHRRGARLTVVPYNTKRLCELAAEHDGVFLSNGPGNPQFPALAPLVDQLRDLLARESQRAAPLPIFGICLGNQLLGLAAGAQTRKMAFGNRGHNQPCIDLDSGRCHLTMQNHGYAIDAQTLPENAGWREWFRNANDGSCEGIRHADLPFRSVQFHPEAAGGPCDTEFLFDWLVERSMLRLARLAAGDPSDPGRQLTASTPRHSDGRDEKAWAVAEKTIVDRHSLMRPFLEGPQAALKDAGRERPSTCLLLGSGGLSIGQAGEFDYSGSQALKALREEGIRTILINPNVATVQTSPGLADKVYFAPVTPDFVAQAIEREQPDAVLLQFGGQTALNAGTELDQRGVFARHNVRVLGTPVHAIVDTEDRARFADRLAEIGEPTAPSAAARSVDQAVEAASRIGYPVILRAGYALGGLGSGFAYNEQELRDRAQSALAQTDHVLVERSLRGWKEVEYEILRDRYDNAVTVTNMENMDPMGVHTGESVVVAPSQTLTDREYHLLRRVALRIARHLGVIGECNCQLALSPDSEEYYVIEVNARLSRSSALASKATGYPLAFVAAKLALGYSLPELVNQVTGSTSACWEPSLDYVVVKMPRWDLGKFTRVDRTIGSAMKSVGEVMSIGRTFEEALQKAVRMVDGDQSLGFLSGQLPPTVAPPLADGAGFSAKTAAAALASLDRTHMLDTGLPGPKDEDVLEWGPGDGTLDEQLRTPNDRRVWVLAEALGARGYGVQTLHQLTQIDLWFLRRMARIVRIEIALKSLGSVGPLQGLDVLTPGRLARAKRLGFSDRAVGHCISATEYAVRDRRHQFGLRPRIKQIDTVAGEFPTAKGNYLYLTYADGVEDDVELPTNPLVVMGSGPYRIGSSVEFDWCAVAAVNTLRSLGRNVALINSNPETVSTDYDVPDRLYFEELSLETVVDICNVEQAEGVVVSVGGQAPNNIVVGLARAGVSIVGTSADSIDMAENRFKFSRLLDTIGVHQPPWRECSKVAVAAQFCERVGYPCLVRPSFVLSGAGMAVVHSSEELRSYLKQARGESTGDEDSAAPGDDDDDDGDGDYDKSSGGDAGNDKNGPDAKSKSSMVNNDNGDGDDDDDDDGALASPLVVSKFVSGAKEIDVDAVADSGNLLFHAVCEHVENAGVHSGDATLVLPARDLDETTKSRIGEATAQIARALRLSGPFNIQFIAKDQELLVIECNVRCSRSFPFVAKTLGVDMMRLAMRAALGLPIQVVSNEQEAMKLRASLRTSTIQSVDVNGTDKIINSPTLADVDDGITVIDLSRVRHVGVKVAQFSFTRLIGADPITQVEMASTGEVAGFGRNVHEAYLKALVATGFRLPQPSADGQQQLLERPQSPSPDSSGSGGVLLSIGQYAHKRELLPSALILARLGFQLYATPGTADFLAVAADLHCHVLDWDSAAAAAGSQDTVRARLQAGSIAMAIMLPSKRGFARSHAYKSRGYLARRAAVDNGVSLITDVKLAKLAIASLGAGVLPLRLSSVDERSARRTVTLPGLVEVHAHLREPGGEHKEDWGTGTAAALAGGYTHVLAMPNTAPAIVNRPAMDTVLQLAAAKARCDYGIYAGAGSVVAQQNPDECARPLAWTETAAESLRQFWSQRQEQEDGSDGTGTDKATSDQLPAQIIDQRWTGIGGACALKMYLDPTFTNASLRMSSMEDWLAHIRAWPPHVPLVVHAERRTMAATLMLAVTLTGRSVHVAHVSTAEEVAVLRAARARGLPVTSEVTPHHLFLTDADRASLGDGTKGWGHVCPALSSSADQEALWAGLRDGTLDCVATDHAPHTRQEKAKGEQAPPGFPGMETALPLMLTAVRQGRISLARLVAVMSDNPRRIFGLPEQPDTFIEVDLDAEWTIPEAPAHSRAQWTPFAGRRVCGKLRRVVVRGAVKFSDGKVTAKPGTGRLLPPVRGADATATALSFVQHARDEAKAQAVTPDSSFVGGANASDYYSSSSSGQQFTTAIPKQKQSISIQSATINAIDQAHARESALAARQQQQQQQQQQLRVGYPGTLVAGSSPAPSTESGVATRRRPSTGPPALSSPVSSPLPPRAHHKTETEDGNPQGVAAAAAAPKPMAVPNQPAVAAGLPSRKPVKQLASLRGSDILSWTQFNRENLHHTFAVALDMRMQVLRHKRTKQTLNLLNGRVLATAFYEPSTRTSLSFQTAMLRLGGSVVTMDAASSSVTKGETLADTAATLASYADVVVLRHPEAGAARLAADASSVPVINAGDGTGEHPTQALLDTFTIREELGTVNNLDVCMVGDLKHGRTVHSLALMLATNYNVRLHFVSPDSLRMPDAVLQQLTAVQQSRQSTATSGDESPPAFYQYSSLDQVIGRADVLYITRIQRERFADAAEYEATRDSFVITPNTLTRAKPHCVIMHPLPRNNEIAREVDTDPRAAYFRQMENGMYIRMALLAIVLGEA